MGKVAHDDIEQQIELAIEKITGTSFLPVIFSMASSICCSMSSCATLATLTSSSNSPSSASGALRACRRLLFPLNVSVHIVLPGGHVIDAALLTGSSKQQPAMPNSLTSVSQPSSSVSLFVMITPGAKLPYDAIAIDEPGAMSNAPFTYCASATA